MGHPVLPKLEVAPFFILSDKRKRRKRERAQPQSILVDWGVPFDMGA